MAGSVNRVILVGNLGKDPEVRSMQNGGKVANLSVATSESWRDKASGERKEKTEWHRVTIFGKLAEIAEKYCKKGTKLYVCGSLQTRKWQDKDGNDRYSTEVVLQGYNAELEILSGGRDNRRSAGMGSASGGFEADDTADWDAEPPAADSGKKRHGADFNDDIPF